MGPKAYSYIRMSTPEQRKGDSLRRQLEATEGYVTEHGLVLDQEFKFRDLGISAFTGANRSRGALGRFIEAVKEGRVAKGSHLIVESLDRLSRLPVMDALMLFIDIHRSGINIVTLIDQEVYRADEELDFKKLQQTLSIFFRANNESATKRDRMTKLWEAKRTNAPTKKMTKIGPAWLRMAKNRKSFQPIPDRAAIVQRIFEMSAGGFGILAVAKALNKERVQPFGKSKNWTESYIAKILANRAVLGELQAHRYREKAGPPIPNYYPAIISEELFARCVTGKHERLTRGRGRRGSGQTNLFSGLLKCGFCGATCRYLNKGSGPKGGSYLRCVEATRGACQARSWAYRDFEKSFLSFVEELNIAAIIHDEAFAKPLSDLENKIAIHEAEKIKFAKQTDNLLEVIKLAGPESHGPLAKEYVKVSAQLREAEGALEDAIATRRRTESDARSLLSDRDQVKHAVASLQSLTPDSFKHRVRVRAVLQSLVEDVQIRFGEFLFFTIEGVRRREWETSKEPGIHKHFIVNFKKGLGRRTVAVNPNDPADFLDQSVFKPGSGFTVTKQSE